MPQHCLHRHQLVWLTRDGWRQILDAPWDAQARECLAWWADDRLPLVVTRQHAQSASTDAVSLGLAAPAKWRRRRLAMEVPKRDLMVFDEFPQGRLVERQLPVATRAAWRDLCSALEACGATPRIHGSHGWEHVTRLSYVRRQSDIDICLRVQDGAHADAVAALLDGWQMSDPRLDGELAFPNGAAVAWREWIALRTGRSSAVLVKELHGCRLAKDPLRDQALEFGARQ